MDWAMWHSDLLPRLLPSPIRRILGMLLAGKVAAILLPLRIDATPIRNGALPTTFLLCALPGPLLDTLFITIAVLLHL
jgi:hypothetical protein